MRKRTAYLMMSSGKWFLPFFQLSFLIDFSWTKPLFLEIKVHIDKNTREKSMIPVWFPNSHWLIYLYLQYAPFLKQNLFFTGPWGDFGVTLGALKEPGLMSISSDPLFMDLDMQEKHIILCLIPELALAE